MAKVTDPYSIMAKLGGKKRVVSDQGKVTWNIGETGLPFADDSIFDYTNSHRHYDPVFEWMDLKEFMDIQWRVYEMNVNRNNEHGGTFAILMRPSEYWVKTVTESKVAEITKLMNSGAVFNSLVVEIDKDGKLLDFQEGRHRSVALKRMGITKVPVWIVKKRF
jgi:hypothetical protein